MLTTWAFMPRIAEMARWNGRLYFAGAAMRFLPDRIVRIIALMSPPVAIYVAAVASTTACGGSYASSQRAILSEMYAAVLGCTTSI